MKIIRIFLFSVFGLLLLLLLAFTAMWFFNPGAPKIVMTDPAPNGRRIDEGGLLANYYAPAGSALGEGSAHPGVLLIGGSEGGLGGGMSRMTTTLQARGYAVLHVSYFGAPGQNRQLEMIPLETFDRALAFLISQEGVDKQRLAIIGASKGAEAALLVASRHPEIRAVVAGMPSHVVWQGIDWNIAKMIVTPPGSSWSLGGAPVPYLPYGRPEKPGGAIAEVYRAGLATLDAHPDAIIPIERAAADTLLICGEADTLWPSCDMARAVKARAEENDGPRVAVLAFAGAGHAVFGVPLDDADPDVASLARAGGSGEGNNAARKDAWPKALAHLDAAMQAPRPPE